MPRLVRSEVQVPVAGVRYGRSHVTPTANEIARRRSRCGDYDHHHFLDSGDGEAQAGFTPARSHSWVLVSEDQPDLERRKTATLTLPLAVAGQVPAVCLQYAGMLNWRAS